MNNINDHIICFNTFTVNCATVPLQLKVILFTKQIRKNRIASYYIFWYPYRAAIRATPYRIMYSRLQNTRLREVPHFSSGIVERAKRKRAWKSPHARKGDTRREAFSRVGWFSCALASRSLYYPWGKMGTTRSLQNTWCFCKTHERKNGQAKALEWGWKQSVGLGRNKKKMLPRVAWGSHVRAWKELIFSVDNYPCFQETKPTVCC